VRRFWGVPVLVLVATFAAAPPARAGCCTPTSDPSVNIYTAGLDDPDRCANVGGTITTQEGCEAQASQGHTIVIGGTTKTRSAQGR